MGKVFGKDIPLESQFMSDFWNFRKKFYIPEESDEYWEELCDVADELIKKYDCAPYVQDIVRTCVHDLERTYKEKVKRK